jgi:hypothetical protein
LRGLRIVLAVSTVIAIGGCSSGRNSDNTSAHAATSTTAPAVPVDVNTSKCPSQLTDGTPASSAAGSTELVWFAATSIRICKYDLDGPFLASGRVFGAAVTAIEAEVNHFKHEPRDYAPSCPRPLPSSPMFIVTFFIGIEHVDVWDLRGCGLVTNGELEAQSTGTWRTEMDRLANIGAP